MTREEQDQIFSEVDRFTWEYQPDQSISEFLLQSGIFNSEFEVSEEIEIGKRLKKRGIYINEGMIRCVTFTDH